MLDSHESLMAVYTSSCQSVQMNYVLSAGLRQRQRDSEEEEADVDDGGGLISVEMLLNHLFPPQRVEITPYDAWESPI